MKSIDVFHGHFTSPIGMLQISATKFGVCSIAFIDIQVNDLQAKLNNVEVPAEIQSHILLAEKQLKEYFNGIRKEFTIPLDMHGPEFQKQVWQNLLSIPYGTRKSYMQQAIQLGNKKAIRAVANANGKNKIAIVVPCHRVIGSNGKLTGYAGGLEKKKWLLQLELKNSDQSNTLF